MTFGQPLWLWGLALLPLLTGLFFHHEAQRGRLLRKLVAARLEGRLAGSLSLGKRRWRFALLSLALGAAVLSLAQPRAGYTWETSQRRGRDVIIAIDVSRSMLSTDVAPDRLTRAKLAAEDLIRQLPGDRVGLIAFAGTAFLQAPLTADYSAVLTSLNELDTDIIPLGGTNLAEAIRMAAEAFGKGEGDSRALIIFTDGEELDADGVQAAAGQKEAMRIFGVGVGSADGSLIPIPGARGGTDFVRDENGQFVKSRLDEDRLRKIAQSTGGFYLHLQNGPAEMTQIVRQGLGKMTDQDIDAKLSRQPIERYQWPLGVALAALVGAMLMGERRRRPSTAPLALLAGCLLLAASQGLQAAAARELYEAGEYEEAAKAYQEEAAKAPQSDKLAFNWGAAAYKSKDLDTALKAFSQALTSRDPQLREKAEFNLGNTLYQKGSSKKEIPALQDALQHYQQALKMAPADANAKYNEEVTRNLIAQLQQEQEKKQQEDQQKQDSQDPQKKEQKNSKNSQKQNGQDQQKQEKQGAGEKQDGQQGAQDPNGKDQAQAQAKGGKQGQAAEQGGQEQGQASTEPKEQKSDAGAQKDAPLPGQAGQEKGEGKAPEDAQNGKAAPDTSSEKGGDKDGQKPAPQSAEDAEGKDGSEADGKGHNGAQPKKPEGEIKAAHEQPGQQAKDLQEEAAADAVAAAAGKMTERQAKELVESMRGEDERVRLLDPKDRRAARVLRNW